MFNNHNERALKNRELMYLLPKEKGVHVQDWRCTNRKK